VSVPRPLPQSPCLLLGILTWGPQTLKGSTKTLSTHDKLSYYKDTCRRRIEKQNGSSMVIPIPTDDALLNKELVVLRFCTIGDCSLIVQMTLSSYVGVSVRLLESFLEITGKWSHTV
jgi:hypothetical protein